MLMRTALQYSPPKRRISQPQPIGAPVGGLDTASPLANMPLDRAVELTNWFPQPGYIEIRKGFRQHATDVTSDTTPVETLMPWHGPAASKMFAAGGGAIYDVTLAQSGTITTVTSKNEDRWQWVNFTNSGGHYLWACNGTDNCVHYNGTTWAEPSISGVTSADIINVNAHKNRLWLIEKESTKVWYLATDAIAGAATGFELGGLFSRGGYVMAMATWTRDGGSGSDDYAVFVTSQGQCAVYQGTDPSSASTWALVGVFNIPHPIGRRCFTKWGGDVLILTDQGVFPLSQLLAVDASAVTRVAISQNIAPTLTEAASSYASLFGWQVEVHPNATMLIVNVPTAENSTAVQYVMNTLTGAWCKFDSHNANCWLSFDDEIYFGDNTGRVCKANTGALDLEDQIVATGQSAYNAFGTANKKQFMLIRPIITASGGTEVEVGISTDFSETDSLSASSGTSSAVATWDNVTWDNFTWAASTNEASDWINSGGIGSFGSIKFRGRVGTTQDSALWGTATWGGSNWGYAGATAEIVRLNAFLITVHEGGIL